MTSHETGAAGKPPSPRVLRLAVAGSALLMVGAGLVFFYASHQAQARRAANAGHETLITIRDHACEPNDLSVPAGPNSFRIVNQSQRAVEWEILDGVLVIEERENIAPGLSQVINATLQPGRYAITCGLLSNPRGSLTVTPTAASEAAAKARPALTAFIGPLSEYRVYLASQSSALVRAGQALKDAIQAGDLQQAQAAYGAARVIYQRIAPASQRLAELDNRINARADYFEQREQDPAFAGLHRIEYSLFQQRTTEGLTPVADALLADLGELKTQLLAQSIAPQQFTEAVVRSLRNLAQIRSSGEEERYSHLDLQGFAANLEGVRKVIDLLRPLLARTGSQPLAAVDSAMTQFEQHLQALRGAEGYMPYDQVPQAQKQQIAADADALANAIAAIDQALGLADQ
ncbi:iron uptake system protein EfeO [Pseudomonas sp. RW10S2]|uniref:iron uptake system protein EfeO n=1 Tax=Pseudomonas TaxID=286 RepID=UPI001645ACDB|nr:iron uptake system protein EfeO [Pseudomonas sp. RW10S2]MBC3465157.1 iron uptake system protein EfeO [Pseudomonas sp. RW10S2]QXI41333.1 iron uptake system protein EfeO [Pseudomonas wayambapalatensis]